MPANVGPLANDPNFPLVGSDPATASALFGFGYGANGSGIPVTPWSALNSATVFACVRVLAEAVASLPLVVERRLPAGGWTRDEDHPLNAVFDAPNDWHSAFDALSYLTACYTLRGNGYAVILRDGSGRPRQFIPLSADRVMTLIAEDGRLYYGISHQTIADGASLVVSREDMLHVRNISLNGFTGVSPIEACANAIGLTLALDEYGTTLFRNGASIPGVLTMPGKLGTEARQRTEEAFAQRHAGVQNAGKLLVLDNGATFSPMGMKAAEAQFLEARGFSVAELATRVFGVPAHMVGDLSGANYNTLEAQNQSFIDRTLRPICERFEQEAARVLLFDHERRAYRIKFDFAEMLRGDTPTRFNSYSVGISMGFMSANEAREREGMPPRDGGDEFFTPGTLNVPKPNDPMGGGDGGGADK